MTAFFKLLNFLQAEYLLNAVWIFVDAERKETKLLRINHILTMLCIFTTSLDTKLVHRISRTSSNFTSILASNWGMIYSLWKCILDVYPLNRFWMVIDACFMILNFRLARNILSADWIKRTEIFSLFSLCLTMKPRMVF